MTSGTKKYQRFSGFMFGHEVLMCAIDAPEDKEPNNDKLSDTETAPLSLADSRLMEKMQ